MNDKDLNKPKETEAEKDIAETAQKAKKNVDDTVEKIETADAEDKVVVENEEADVNQIKKDEAIALDQEIENQFQTPAFTDKKNGVNGKLFIGMAIGVLSTLLIGAIFYYFFSNPTIVKTTGGTIKKNELYEQLKSSQSESVLANLVATQVLDEKYNVSEKEIDEQINLVKNYYGDQYDSIVSQSFKDEAAFRDYNKLQLLMEKAAKAKVKITDADIQTYYNEYQPDIKVSRIIVSDEAKANELKARIDAGEDFAALAKENNIDGSNDAGGDLGFQPASTWTSHFAENATLEVGQVSNVTQSEEGYEFIKITEKKEKDTLENMKKQIEDMITSEKIQDSKIQQDLQKEIVDGILKINDNDFKDLKDLISPPVTTEQ